MPEYVEGVDVSKWQGEINWSVLSSKGMKFAFIRAGYSIYLDSYFIRNSEEAPKYLNYIGYYWYFYPTISPEDQAIKFANAIKDKVWNLPPVVDVEIGSNGANLRSFIKKLKELLNIKYVMIYTRESLWDAYYPEDEVFKMMPLWAARYKSTLTSPWSDGYYKFRDWNNWAFWQYTSNLSGYYYGTQSAGLDGDKFNGNESDLINWIKVYGRYTEEKSWEEQVTDALRSLGFDIKNP